jgi:U2 small nuclear ribonucleoprotein B''
MNEPNQTLYVANIDWKIKKPILRRALHTLFNRHGKIQDIIALRSDGLRGQAFVLFDTVQSATSALQAEQGFTFFGKDLKLEYAKEKSDRIAKRDGTFVPKDRRKKRAAEAQLSKDDAASGEKKIKLDQSLGAGPSATISDPSSLVKEAENDTNLAEADGANPSNILFADSLPEDCNEMMLRCLFVNYNGYKEVRIPRKGLAFIEFDDETQATIALKALNGFKLSASDTLNLKYGKS